MRPTVHHRDTTSALREGHRHALVPAWVRESHGVCTSPAAWCVTGAVEREKAAMGLFVTLDPPSRDMLTEATVAGFYRFEPTGREYPRIQILTVEDLLKRQAVQ